MYTKYNIINIIMQTCEPDNIKGLLKSIMIANLVWLLDNLVNMPN